MNALYPPKREVSLGLRLAIFLVPYFSVWLLLKEGYSTRARVLGFAWLTFAFIFVLRPLMMGIMGQPYPYPDRYDAVTVQTPKPAESSWPRVTARQFGMLTPGRVTYSFVKGLWGPGELGAASNAGGTKIEVYTWTNPEADGGSMQLTFENDRLVMKVQAGLP